MKLFIIKCLTLTVFSFYYVSGSVYGQSESGGLLSKLMMMMMKNRRRTYVPFPMPFPLSYSSLIPFNYPATLPIGGYPNYRTSLINTLSSGAHLGPLSPLGGIGPFSLGGLGALPFLSSLRSDAKFLSRSSPIYEPTVASSSIVPSYAVVAPPVSAPATAASSNSFLITNPATISNTLNANQLSAALNNLNALLPASAFAQPLAASSTNHLPSSAINAHPLLSASPSNAISNAHSFSLSNSSPLTNNNPTLSNSHLSNSHSYSGSTHPTLLSASSNQAFVNSNSSTSTYSNAASNGNSLTDKTMTGSQGELIKQELKEHHLNNIRIQYLKSLRDHLIRDQQLKEQYLKELTKKSAIVYPYPHLEMYEELGNKKK